MKFKILMMLILMTGLSGHTYGQQKVIKTDKKVLKLINKSLEKADVQYRYFSQHIPAGLFPRSLDADGKLITSNSDWWCSGFYPGTLLYLYKATGDSVLYNEAQRKMLMLSKEQYNKSTHDLCFMMYCSFGNAYQLHPDTVYRNILLNSAKSLASRFDARVGCIRSWNSRPSDFLVIIDNMMNLELLFWATRITGDSSYYHIAVTHANTTLKNHFRADYSSYHQVNYQPETGVPQRKRTVQGAADSSAWARGQGWGLYGYTVMYRETHDLKYLNQAKHIANFTLNHPRLPKDLIPYWDFDAADIPNAPRDASAAAVIASALIELSGYTDGVSAAGYLRAAGKIITELSAPQYMAAPGTNGGFLLKHSVGNLPGKSEIDKPLTYADYYYVEAMLRYKALTY